MTDTETIAAYDARVDAYADIVKRDKPDPALIAFIARLPTGGYVLDLGCGPGNASAIMRDNGLRVDPVDASAQMVQLANATHDIGARQADFSEIEAIATYDGVWANFILLHASAADFPVHLGALHHALKPDGILHIGMKLGDGASRDRLGRLYSYYSEEQLATFLGDAGFTVLETLKGEDLGLAGDVEPWIIMVAVRCQA